MNRRSLFKRLGAAAAVVAVAPAAVVQAEPEIDEHAEVEALMKRMLAEPDKYPDLWARVRELQGQSLPVASPTMQMSLGSSVWATSGTFFLGGGSASIGSGYTTWGQPGPLSKLVDHSWKEDFWRTANHGGVIRIPDRRFDR